MGCGILVVSPVSPSPGSPADAEGRAPAPADLAHELAEALRAGGHSVVECDTPLDRGIARGSLEEAWVLLAGLDLVVVVEEEGSADLTGVLLERARELMTDRGPGGAIVWVPCSAPPGVTAASLLELADSGSLPEPPLEVETVPPRAARGPAAEHRRFRVVHGHGRTAPRPVRRNGTGGSRGGRA